MKPIIKTTQEQVKELKKSILEMDEETFYYIVSQDTSFGLWLKNPDAPLKFWNDKSLDVRKEIYSMHCTNVLVFTKAYLTEFQYIIWN